MFVFSHNGVAKGEGVIASPNRTKTTKKSQGHSLINLINSNNIKFYPLFLTKFWMTGPIDSKSPSSVNQIWLFHWFKKIFLFISGPTNPIKALSLQNWGRESEQENQCTFDFFFKFRSLMIEFIRSR